MPWPRAASPSRWPRAAGSASCASGRGDGASRCPSRRREAEITKRLAQDRATTVLRRTWKACARPPGHRLLVREVPLQLTAPSEAVPARRQSACRRSRAGPGAPSSCTTPQARPEHGSPRHPPRRTPTPVRPARPSPAPSGRGSSSPGLRGGAGHPPRPRGHLRTGGAPARARRAGRGRWAGRCARSAGRRPPRALAPGGGRGRAASRLRAGGGPAVQRARLRAEGVALPGGRVDLLATASHERGRRRAGPGRAALPEHPAAPGAREARPAPCAYPRPHRQDRLPLGGPAHLRHLHRPRRPPGRDAPAQGPHHLPGARGVRARHPGGQAPGHLLVESGAIRSRDLVRGRDRAGPGDHLQPLPAGRKAPTSSWRATSPRARSSCCACPPRT